MGQMNVSGPAKNAYRAFVQLLFIVKGVGHRPEGAASSRPAETITSHRGQHRRAFCTVLGFAAFLDPARSDALRWQVNGRDVGRMHNGPQRTLRQVKSLGQRFCRRLEWIQIFSCGLSKGYYVRPVPMASIATKRLVAISFARLRKS